MNQLLFERRPALANYRIILAAQLSLVTRAFWGTCSSNAISDDRTSLGIEAGMNSKSTILSVKGKGHSQHLRTGPKMELSSVALRIHIL